MISETVEKPLASWQGKERYGSEQLDCLTVIFRSGGCSWSKCRMCSYRHERYRENGCSDLLTHLRGQLTWVSREYKPDSYRMVKIFTSGSFFDPVEVPPAFLADIAKFFQ